LFNRQFLVKNSLRDILLAFVRKTSHPATMFRWLHYIGVAFLFISALLLLITTISSPVIGDIAILKVMLTNHTDIRHSSVTFGSFGHCVLDVPPVTTDQDLCFPKSIGYKPAVIMSEIDGPTFNKADTGTVDALTNAFVLHPVACALAFIAAVVALGGVAGSLVGLLIATVAWVITVVVMAIDFAVFGVSCPHSCLSARSSTNLNSTDHQEPRQL
jgi:hypothetical protein